MGTNRCLVTCKSTYLETELSPIRRRKPTKVGAVQTVETDTFTPAPPRPHGSPAPTQEAPSPPPSKALANEQPHETDEMGRTYWFLEKFKDGYGGTESRLKMSKKDGNLISSRTDDEGNWHAPLFDIDYDAELIPSKTPGHYHLYLNKKIPWEKYLNVLKAMAEADLIEENYYLAAKQRGKAMLTIPSESGAVHELLNKIKKTGVLFPDA